LAKFQGKWETFRAKGGVRIKKLFVTPAVLLLDEKE
jgi:hypothetical protein